MNARSRSLGYMIFRVSTKFEEGRSIGIGILNLLSIVSSQSRNLRYKALNVQASPGLWADSSYVLDKSDILRLACASETCNCRRPSGEPSKWLPIPVHRQADMQC